MTTYESNDDVQPVRVTTYRHLRKATRRGWAVPVESEPSLADLMSNGAQPLTRGRRVGGAERT
ncbi:hypothetical protein SAMN05660766_1836 [Curtobacterium sp. 314Chir4.1]|jgi:hypothetical protein|uniref:hypothetical protein n=1 Tax=Curtobacterium sp. 314Chir4.1 TaxID=1279028 RepID=UPI000BC43BFB|nr:hypothetical protein [Curtobacterium sp. 314Chir4.1]SOC88138.1 hypothetical protein SAMN05660766_1836 [Curtobacterium sp. 314Chir4.1]